MCLIVIFFVFAALLVLYFLAVFTGIALSLIPWIIVGLIAGWIASKVTESRHGVLGDIGIGLVGSLLGGILYVIFVHRPVGGAFSPTRLFVSIGGSILLLLIVKAFRRAA